MSQLVPYCPSSVVTAISTSAATSTITLTAAKTSGQSLYILVCTVAAWYCQGASPTATAGSGSFYVNAGEPTLLDGWNGAHVSILGTASGSAVIAPALKVT